MKGSVYLLLTSAIWGFALVAQKEGMSYLDAFSFTALRCLLGGLSLLPLVLWRNRQTGQSTDADSKKNLNENADGISDVNQNQNADRSPDVNSACCKKTTWIAALQCGFFLTCLMLFQQLGLPYTTVGKAAFVTSLYIPITPLLERFSGKKISRRIWISIGITMFGIYLLCFSSGMEKFSIGDLCMMGAALAASLQMLAVDKWVSKIDAVKLSCYQFLVAGILCIPLSLFFGKLTLSGIRSSLIPLLYAGICSCGLGYTFQTIGQKTTSAAKAAILLSLETVFSLIAGMIFYQEQLSLIEYAGCAIMLAGVILSQYSPSLPNDAQTTQISEKK